MFISGQYLCQHKVTNRGVIETETGWRELGRDGSINFKEDSLYSLGFLHFPWDYADSDNRYVGRLLVYICHCYLFHLLVMVIQFFTIFIDLFLSFASVNNFLQYDIICEVLGDKDHTPLLPVITQFRTELCPLLH